MNHHERKRDDVKNRALQLAIIQILDGAVGQLDHGLPLYGDWSVQGFGVLRLFIRKIGRLHIWTQDLRAPGVSMTHNHSWNLASTIVAGELRNTKFADFGPAPSVGDLGRDLMLYNHMRLLTGYESRPLSNPEVVILREYPGQVYRAGDTYVQAAEEIHRTDALDGTVTLMARNEDTNGEADVYWPLGTEWGSAKPRPATPAEIRLAINQAMRWLL